MTNSPVPVRAAPAVARVLVALLLVPFFMATPGCSSDAALASLKKDLEELRQRPRGAIQPPPEFTPQPVFTYSVHQLRSPFLPPSDEAVAAESETKVVAPDMTRPREYLEQFNIEGLKLKGSIQKPGGALTALIEDPESVVTPVRVGNYVGKNYGRVAAIEEGKVSVLEVVPDGHDGWVERPRTIRLEGQ